MSYFKILKNYLYWLLTFIFVCLVGASDIFAAEYFTTYDDVQIYYDNNGSLTFLGGSWNDSLQAYVSPTFTTTAKSYGGYVLFNSPIPLIQNHTYTLVINFEQRKNIALSSKPRISIGSSQNATISAYNNSTYNANTIQSNVLNSTILQYVFKANVNAGYIGLPWSTTSTTTQNYVLNSISIEDLGSEGVSEQSINNSLINQTNTLNNSINNSTNIITGALNSTEDNIINNQNQNNQQIIENNNSNTDKIIESNKENFNDCNVSRNLFDLNWFKLQNSNGVTATIQNNYILLNGTATSTTYFNFFVPTSTFSGIKKWYYMTSAEDLDFVLQAQRTGQSVINMFINNSFKTTSFDSSFVSSGYLRVNSGTVLNNVKVYILVSDNDVNFSIGDIDKEIYGKDICVNKLDQQTNALNDLNSSLNNSDSSDATNSAGNFFSGFNTDTYGLTSVITAPLSFIQGLSSKTCNSLNIPLPYVEKNLVLPCMSDIYSQYFGTFFTMYQTITFSIIAYWVCVRIFNLVKDFKNPEHDEIEVFDL